MPTTRPTRLLLLVLLLGLSAAAQETPPPAPAGAPVRGLIHDDPAAAPGYVLFSPLLSGTTYLVDRKGRVVRTWESAHAPGASVYMLDDGHLLRAARLPEFPVFQGGGQGGRIEEFTWDGELVWEYELASEERLQHHDIEPLPDGNVLLIFWESKSREEALRAGRRPDRIAEQGLWPDGVLEIEPLRPVGGRVVWEWHVWDHLIQDTDPRFGHYGDPAEHPELVDINGDREPEPYTDEELEELRALGYIGGTADDDPPDVSADWLHTNAVAYNAELDQIALSARRFDEIWIIDHGTTTAQAAGHAGGRWGRGGDLLYRWGNPRAYGRGDLGDLRLLGQHDVRWIPPGLPGAGNLLVFNNGDDRLSEPHSTVLELTPPMDDRGTYVLGADGRFGPEDPVWSYAAPDKTSFYSEFISGAQRLPDGNTLVCEGKNGRVFEVTPEGAIVWEYRNPYSGTIRTADGGLPQPGLDTFPRAVFRATFLAADHPAFAGRELAPLVPQPPIVEPPPDVEVEPETPDAPR